MYDFSEKSLENTLNYIKIGMQELQIKQFLIQELYKNGAEGLSFDPIVLTGKNSAIPHGHSSNQNTIKHGDTLLFDFGAAVKGYKADITRTFFMIETDEYQRKAYETVRQANEIGIQKSKMPNTVHDVDNETTLILENSDQKFREQSLIYLARKYYNSKNYILSNKYYLDLKEITSSNSLKREVLIRLMHGYENINREKAANYANQVLDFDKKDNWLLSKAYTIIARNSFDIGNYIKSKKKYIDIRENIDNFNDKFDVITMFHVLEHLPKQIDILKNCRKHLKNSNFCGHRCHVRGPADGAPAVVAAKN